MAQLVAAAADIDGMTGALGLTTDGDASTIIRTMIVTIDGAGRLVVPKEIRVQAHLEPGMRLEIRLRDGRIEIEPAARRVSIEKRGRLRVAVPAEPPPRLTAASVRATRDRIHRER
jgi:AbrB family looped-hinge helix DNA binding protein